MADIVPDSEHRKLAIGLPEHMRHFASLARFDRPIGWWLLYWPCFWGIALAGGMTAHWDLALWMLLGAIAMRGAGCVYNDIVDRDLDAKVARTALRPLASRVVSVKAAWIWLFVLCLIGLVVLLRLNVNAQLLAIGSLLLVAAYPFMKRITWWPQLWLGLVFSWGALVGWIAVAQQAQPAMFWLYAGTIFWVIGYDTIYAMQDREDDALIGVKSSALRLGSHIQTGVAIFYALALLCWGEAVWSVRPQYLALIAVVPVALHLLWQIATLQRDGSDALHKFRSNRFAGLLAGLAFLVVGSA